jgi:hypothetical protein
MHVPKNSLYLVKVTAAETSAVAMMSLPFIVQCRHAMIRAQATSSLARFPGFLTNDIKLTI